VPRKAPELAQAVVRFKVNDLMLEDGDVRLTGGLTGYLTGVASAGPQAPLPPPAALTRVALPPPQEVHVTGAVPELGTWQQEHMLRLTREAPGRVQGFHMEAATAYRPAEPAVGRPRAPQRSPPPACPQRLARSPLKPAPNPAATDEGWEGEIRVPYTSFAFTYKYAIVSRGAASPVAGGAPRLANGPTSPGARRPRARGAGSGLVACRRGMHIVLCLPTDRPSAPAPRPSPAPQATAPSRRRPQPSSWRC
jgi:hypothetical protein